MAERSEVLEQQAGGGASPVYSVAVEDVTAEGLPPGYKKTEVGVIPEDWSALPLGDVLTLRRGFDLPHRTRKDGEFPIISSSGTSGNHEAAKVSGPGVVTGRYGTIGQVFYIATDFWPLNTTLYVLNFKGSDPRYVYYLLRKVDFLSHSGKSGVPGVNRKDIHKEQVAVPPLPEQHAIATALSDVDALIDSLDRLIAKKRDIKQATMQQLLTGKTRLPGFEGEWETKRLGDVATVDPENLGADTPPDYEVNYISLEQVEQGKLLGWSEEKFASAPSRARRVLRKGDVLVATVRPNLKSHLIFDGTIPDAICSTGFAVVRCNPSSADSGYVYAHMFAITVNSQIEKIIAGSNYPAISSSDVKELEVQFPSLKEQTSIATVLSDMDAEIEALKRRRKKIKQIKQGMMQELLTGRTRLVEPKQKTTEECSENPV